MADARRTVPQRCMGRLIWKGWAALCLLAGTVVVPLFWEVFSGGSALRFLAILIRYAWIRWLAWPILREGWLPTRWVAAGLLSFVVVLCGGVWADLLGFTRLHPGWFLTLEWWQRPLYPWLDLVPRFYVMDRPGYLWIAVLWTFVEGIAFTGLLLRWRPRGAETEEIAREVGLREE